MNTDAKAPRSTAWLRLWRWLLAGDVRTNRNDKRDTAAG